LAGSLDAVPVVIYSVLRLALMAAVFGITYLLGAGLLIAALLAIVVGWSLSYLLLKPFADAAATWLAERGRAQASGEIPRFSAQISADEAAEDALIESQEPAPNEPPAHPQANGSDGEPDSQ